MVKDARRTADIRVRDLLLMALTFSSGAIDAISYLAAWRYPAAERRRLAGVLFFLFSGAVAGGLLLRYARAYAPVLPLIGGALALAIAARGLRKRGEAVDRE